LFKYASKPEKPSAGIEKLIHTLIPSTEEIEETKQSEPPPPPPPIYGPTLII